MNGSRGERVIAVVPLIGAGTPSDPRRPMFVPKPGDAAAAMAAGQAPAFAGCHFVMTDDGNSAIVEFVTSSRSKLQPLLDAGAAGSIQVFDPNQSSADAVNRALSKRKAGFDLAHFRHLVVPSLTLASVQSGGAQ